MSICFLDLFFKKAIINSALKLKNKNKNEENSFVYYVNFVIFIYFFYQFKMMS